MILIFFYLFIVCTGLQLAFYIGVCLPFSISKQKKLEKQFKQSLVSVIIAAKNEADNLPFLLEKLKRQDYATFEVVVVNDRSDDGSKKILENYAQHNSWLRVLHIDTVPLGFNPKKYALQKGIEQAKGDYLLFTDGDCLPSTNHWISSIVSAYAEDTSIVLGFSDYELQNSLLNGMIRWDTFYTAVQYFSLAYVGMPYMGVGRNLSYKKSLFNRGGGFRKIAKITGGDDDLFIGKVASSENTSIIYFFDSQTVSKPERDWFSWFKQKRRHLSVGVYYPLKVKFVLGLLQFSFIFYYLLLFVLLILTYKIVIVAAVYLFRTLTTWIILNRIANKFYDRKRKWQLLSFMPIFELFYVAYYTVVGIATLINRKIKWK